MTRNALAPANCSTEPITIGACGGDSGDKYITAGNGLADGTCLPSLDVTTPLFGEIFDELILQDGYCALLAEDIDSQSSKLNIIDSFINYRDEGDDKSDLSPNILSPDQLSKVKVGAMEHGRGGGEFKFTVGRRWLTHSSFLAGWACVGWRVFRVRRAAAAYHRCAARTR